MSTDSFCNKCGRAYYENVPHICRVDDVRNHVMETPHSKANTHYKRCAFDAHDVINEWFKDWPSDPRTVYYLGDCLKYLCRAGHKDGEDTSKDLEKALDYLVKAVEIEEE